MKTLPVFLLLALSASAQTVQPVRDLRLDYGGVRRLALVIGNDAYPGKPLNNAVNDAQSMKSALEQSGFKVQVSLNATQQQMESAIDEFTGGVKPGDIALFFYAGHGMQISDQNYLVPVDFQARTEVDAKYKAYPAQRVQENLEAAGAAMQILVLDACRNNPFRSWRGGSEGLAAMQAGRGTYIAFATSPGKTAFDNPEGRNGLFTGELITVLRETGVSLDQVFNRVRERVAEKSRGQQLPWSTSSVTGEFYFKVTTEASTSIPASPEGRRAKQELAFWNSVKDENDTALLEEYLRKYPGGEFASIAKSKLNRLQAAATPPAPAVSPVAPNGPLASDRDDPFVSKIPRSLAPMIGANGPLTESMVDFYINYQAWLLEVPFTPQQRSKLRAMVLQGWKEQDANWMDYDRSSLDFANILLTLPLDDREFGRPGNQAETLKQLRADKSIRAHWFLAAYEEAHRPIAAGNPPLTESMVSHYTFYLGWVYEIPLTQPFKDKLRAMLLEDWKKPKDIKLDMEFLNWQIDTAKHSKEEREYIRNRARPEIITAMRADKGNPDAPWILAAYDAAHPSIAAGNPPLTRQAADAFTELFYFVRNQSGEAHVDVDQSVKDVFAQTIAQDFAKYPPAQQKALAEMPQTWASFRMQWAKSNDADRPKILAGWQSFLHLPPSQRADPQLAAALAAEARADAFSKRDVNTVTEQELLQAARDADLVALQCRRQGGQQDLVNAAAWEGLARNWHAGKEAFVQQRASQQVNAQMLAIMQAQHQQRAQMQAMQMMQGIGVTGQNIVGNFNISPYVYRIREVPR
jgi:hypothetical protein